MKLEFPIMITLQEIRNFHPCAGGWANVLAANGGTKADLNKPFPLSSILDSNNLNDCLWALQCKPGYQHIYRKFAVVCADEVMHLMTDERSLSALDVAWEHSEGNATDEQLAAAWAAAWDVARDAAWDAARDAAWAAAWDAASDAARDAARAAAWDAARDVARDVARDAAWDAARDAAWDAAWDAARAYQSDVLRHALTTGEVIRKCQKN